MNIRQTREQLFKLLFEADSNNVLPKDLVQIFVCREDQKLKDDQKEFIINYANEISENMDNIKENIKRNMKGWAIDRIGIVERVLLVLSAYEIMYDKVPFNISINEAVEIAKIYGDEKTYEFINGVLANIVKK